MGRVKLILASIFLNDNIFIMLWDFFLTWYENIVADIFIQFGAHHSLKWIYHTVKLTHHSKWAFPWCWTCATEIQQIKFSYRAEHDTEIQQIKNAPARSPAMLWKCDSQKPFVI